MTRHPKVARAPNAKPTASAKSQGHGASSTGETSGHDTASQVATGHAPAGAGAEQGGTKY